MIEDRDGGGRNRDRRGEARFDQPAEWAGAEGRHAVGERAANGLEGADKTIECQPVDDLGNVDEEEAEAAVWRCAKWVASDHQHFDVTARTACPGQPTITGDEHTTQRLSHGDVAGVVRCDVRP